MIFYFSMPTDGIVHPKGTMLSGWIRMGCSGWHLLGMSRKGVIPEYCTWTNQHRFCLNVLTKAHGYGSTRAIDPRKMVAKSASYVWMSPATTGQWWLLWRILAERFPGQFDSPAEMVMTSDPALWVKFVKYCWLWPISNYPKFLSI